MKPIGAAVAAAVLLWWTAAGQAAEPVPAPAPLPPERAFPAGTANPGCCCAPCTSCNACTACGRWGDGRLRAWLFYRPLHRVQCGECRSCCGGRWVPLYLYFLGECKEHPCTACGAAGCSSCGAFGRPMFGSATGWGMFGD